MNSLWIALGFLTRFPAKHADFNALDAARSVFWFPLAGLLIGAPVASLAYMTAPLLGGQVAACCALGAWVWLTGALHLDGVADTCDGFSAANRGRAQALSAMKDSRIGAHGACGLGLVLLFKCALIERCIEAGVLVPAVVMAAASARWATGFVLVWAKTATRTGLGVLFAQELRAAPGKWMPWCATLWLGCAVVGACWLIGTGCRVVVLSFCTSLVVTAVALFAFVRRCEACFGGVTGDTHGAAIEVTEVLTLAVHVAVFEMAKS